MDVPRAAETIANAIGPARWNTALARVVVHGDGAILVHTVDASESIGLQLHNSRGGRLLPLGKIDLPVLSVRKIERVGFKPGPNERSPP